MIMFFEENNEFCLLWLLKSNGLTKTKQKTSKSLKHRKKHCVLLKENSFSGGVKMFVEFSMCQSKHRSLFHSLRVYWILNKHKLHTLKLDVITSF